MSMTRLFSGFCLAALMPLAGNVLFADSVSVNGKDLRTANAAMQGDRDSIRTLLQQKADVNAAQGDGMTALHWAAFKDDVEMAQMLLKAGANVKAATRIGALTPLIMACTNGSPAMISVLLAAGADANAANEINGATPLMTAAQAGNPDALKVLLDHGAAANAKETANNETALMFAAAADRAAVIKVLAEHGADLKATTKVISLSGRPLYDDNGNLIPPKAVAPSAVPTGNSAAATVMGGMTALLFAARDGQLNAVRALIDAGADVNEVSAGDKTSPIVMAITNTHYEVGKYLLDHGADPNIANNDGLEALYATIDTQYAPTSWAPVAITAQEKVTYLDLMRQLLDHRANPNARLGRKLWYRPTSHDRAWINPQGATPFWRAAASTDVEAMRLLVEHGADPKIGSAQGDTPLMVAAGVGWARGNFSKNSTAPDSWMAALKYCLALGLDINAQDVQGYTALHGAAFRADNEMIKFLADHGAKLDVRNKRGLAVTDMASGKVMINGDLPIAEAETVALLVKLGAPAPGVCGEACGTAFKRQGK